MVKCFLSSTLSCENYFFREFVTNEATTTWRNEYEDSLGNDSDLNQPRVSVAPVGPNVRIFEQQFQEVETDFVNTLGNPASRRINATFTNINITDQLTLDQTTDNIKLQAPIQHFELSSLADTQHSKVFNTDCADPIIGETSGGIHVDFSAIHSITTGDLVKDDLDEITDDIVRSDQNINRGHLRVGRNVSQYIEVDLDMTHRAINNDQSDMSITDTIPSPKVQEVSKPILNQGLKKVANDWTADKENIVFNPYIAAPIENDSFAANDDDAKKVKYGINIDTNLDENYDQNARKSFSKGSMVNMLVLEEDSTNMQFDPEQASTSKSLAQNEFKNDVDVKTILYDSQNDFDMSITKNIVLCTESNKSKTILFNNSNLKSDISITQCLVENKVIEGVPIREKSVMSQDICYADMSVTQVVHNKLYDYKSANIKECDANDILSENYIKEPTVTDLKSNDNLKEIDVDPSNESSVCEATKEACNQRKTIVLNVDDDLPNFVADVPPQLYQSVNPQGTIIYDREESSIQSTLNVDMGGRSKTKIFDHDISITQAVPTNQGPRRTTIHFNQDDKFADISMTQAIDVFSSNKDTQRRTILFDNDSINADISMTQALPGRIDNNKEVRRGTIHFQDDNLSITEAIPVDIHRGPGVLESESRNKRQTIVFDEDAGNISVTQAIPNNFISSEPKELDEHSRQKSFIDGTGVNISTKNAIHSPVRNKRVTIVFEKDNPMSDMSITQAFPQVFRNMDTEPTNNVNISNNKIEIPFKATESINQAAEDIVVFQASTTPSNKTLTQSIRKINEEEISIIDKPRDIDICDNVTDGTSSRDVSEQGPSQVMDNTLQKREPPITFQKMFNNDVLEANMIKPQEISASQNIVHIILPSRKGDDSKNTSITRIAEKSHKTSECLDSEENLKTTVYAYGITNAYDMERACDEMVDDVNQTSNISSKSNPVKSILNELLDMSNASMEGVEKSGPVVNPPHTIAEIENKSESHSVHGFIPIIGDSEYDIKSVMIDANQEDDLSINKTETDKVSNPLSKPELEYQAPLPIEYKQDICETANVFETKLNKIKKVIKSPLKNRIGNSPYAQENKSKPKALKANKKSISPTKESQETKAKPKSMDIVKVRPSLNPKRQSMVLSREELLSNISMAQAVLQNSSGQSDECMDVSPTISAVNITNSRRQSSRLSREVIKTLKFEDEEMSNEFSMRSDINISPLKKTAFGETSYMKENTKTPIPSYLKDVSDGMKQIMRDLIKPMADVPYSTKIDKGVRKTPSTCSMHIQANLITSSQVDLNYDENVRSTLEQKSIPKNQSYISETTFNLPCAEDTTPGHTIMFDPNNPLNNILIPSFGLIDMEAHKYDPIKCDIIEREASLNEEVLNEVKIVRVATEHEFMTAKQDENQETKDGDHVSDSSQLSCEKNVVPKLVIAKNMEVNTVIAMKPNEQLLDDSSSLTLVDDTLVKSNFDVNIESKEVHVKFTYAFNDLGVPAVPSADLIANPEECRKRSYSSTKSNAKKCTFATIETTPKPHNKIARTSKSPKTSPGTVRKIKSPINSWRKSSSPEFKNPPSSDCIKIIDTKKRSPKKSNIKYNPMKSNPLSVHQVNITKSHVSVDMDHDASVELSETEPILNRRDSEQSTSAALSFASSKNQMHDDDTSKDVKVSDDGSKVDGEWRAEFVPETIYSDFYDCEPDSAAKVKAAVRALPIMG